MANASNTVYTPGGIPSVEQCQDQLFVRGVLDAAFLGSPSALLLVWFLALDAERIRFMDLGPVAQAFKSTVGQAGLAAELPRYLKTAQAIIAEIRSQELFTEAWVAGMAQRVTSNSSDQDGSNEKLWAIGYLRYRLTGARETKPSAYFCYQLMRLGCYDEVAEAIKSAPLALDVRTPEEVGPDE